MTKPPARAVRRPPGGEPKAERRGDGRFGFAVAAAASILALLAVIERAGVPIAVLRALALLAGALALLVIGVSARTMRVSMFYAAGRKLAPRHAGLALAGLGLALLLPLAPPVGGGLATAGLLAGFVCGLAGAALVGGPLLRKAGATSLAEYVCLRFSHGAVRLAAGALTAGVGLAVALAGLAAATATLVAFAGLARPTAAALACLLAAGLLVPGGLAGALWGAAAAFVLPLALLAVSLIVLLAGDGLPGVDDAQWTQALASLAGPNLDPDATRWSGAFLVPALTLGFAAAAPLFGPAAACANRAAAQRAGGVALIWTALAIGMASLAVAATAAFMANDAGQSAAPVPLFSGFAAMAGEPFVLSGLLPLGIAGLGVALGAAGLHVAAAALGNDIIHSVRDRAAMSSRRLAITRALTLAAAIFCAIVIAAGAPDARRVAGFALSLAGIVCAPLLALTIWPRAGSRDALLLIGVGLAATAGAALFGPRALLPERPDLIVGGALVALAAGLAGSLVGRRSEGGAAFVRALLHEPDELVMPDKGA